jgi:hypothetical protein
MRQIGFALIDLATSLPVWRGGLPARVEVLGDDGKAVVRADFDKAGLVVPDSEHPTHRMVECWQITPDSPDLVAGESSVSFDGERIIIDPHWNAPPPEEQTP